MRVNWTEFNEQGFKDGVARPFFKYIHWMGEFFSLSLVCITHGRYAEGTDSEQFEAVESVKPTTSTMTTPTPPVTLPTTITTSQQPAKYKKRSFVSTEDSSEDEDDIDMTMEDNDSSGSSMDEGHVPAKRLRTSTIVTRGSRTTPASEPPATDASIRPHSPSSARDNPNTTTETET